MGERGGAERSGKLGGWERKRTSGSNTRIMHEGNAPSPESLSRPHFHHHSLFSLFSSSSSCCFSLRMYHDRIQPPPRIRISGPDHEKTRLGAPARQDCSGVQYERMLVGMPCDYGSPQLSSSYARSIQQTSPESPIDHTAHQRALNASFGDVVNVASRDIRYAPRLSWKRVAILDQLDQVPWNLMSAFEPSSIIPRLSPHPSL